MLTAVEVVSVDDRFELGESRELFAIPSAADAPAFDYEVAANGERFLVSEPVEDAAVAPDRQVHSLRVVLNWTERLTDR